MTTLFIVIGWAMVVGGSLATLAIRLFLWPDPDRSEREHQLFYGFGPYLLGAAILVALLGVALLRANGVYFDWPVD